MDIIQLLTDYSIDFATEGNRHSAEGWVQVHCPFCEGSQDYHLGYNMDENYWSCYRCGWHSVSETIAKLLHISETEAETIIKGYGLLVPKRRVEPVKKIRIKSFKLPSNTHPLEAGHKKYLEERGFNPDYLEKEWGLLGTGPTSTLDTGSGSNKKILNYRFRIIIPFIWDDQQVSFDSRDITGKHRSKYMACPGDRELISHKEILYGKQEKWKDKAICVEGPTDVWRLGESSYAVSGIKFTSMQVRVISKHFTRVAVCFDADPQAQIQAKKLVSELKFRGVDAFRVDIEGDPGSMKQEDADHLVREIIK